ncbi:MAG TPA: type II secretion system F family protein, partial [Candidatus Paceibacterota bacterium]
MPNFTFKAKKMNGEIHKGEKDAKDRYELYKMLKDYGEEVIFVEEKKNFSLFKNFSLKFFNSVKTQEKINFSRSLGGMIKAGLSMSQALSVMERQGKNPTVKKIISAVNEDIRKGKTLSDSMALFPNMFSKLMIAMVKAGEESGTLSESLRIVTLQMDKSYALKRRIRGALMYPGVILLAMVIIAIVLLTYVVPTLTKTFTELNLSLPSSTKIVLWMSEAVKNDPILGLSIVLFAFIATYFWSRKENGKKVLHFLVLRIPIIGNLIKEVNVARTARTLSSLVTTNIDLLDSLRITTDIVQNVHYKKILETATTSVEKGDPVSKTFGENIKLYPVFMSEMISVGE